MKRRIFAIAAACTALALLSACGKPCDPIPEGKDVKDLKLVQAGGRLCKDEKDVATIDYPQVKEANVGTLYTDAFSKAGWKTESPSDKTYFFTKDDDALFIVTGTSKDRRVPFAIIRYCHERGPGCQRSLSELAKAMEKYKK